MNKSEFIELTNEKNGLFIGKDHNETVRKVADYCYDILNSNEELSRVSEALANTKQSLIEKSDEMVELSKKVEESDYYKNLWIKSLNEINLYRNLCKAQSDIINNK